MTKLERFLKKKKKLEGQIKKIQATSEGAREDLLSTSITGASVTDATLKKNTYKTYSSTVQAIYDMYNNTKDYGGEFLKSIIRTRVSFIGGGGITVIAKKEKVAKAINEFLKDNKLSEGSKLFENVGIGELEGKNLMVLKPDNKTEKILVRNFYCVSNPYVVKMDEKDNQIIKEVVYKSEDKKKGQAIAPIKNLVYVRLGGTPDKINNTMPVVGNCLTDVENASRIKYDLRYNNHLHGRLTPWFKTKDKPEASALNKLLIATNWAMGKAYAGTAEFSLVGPPPGATEALTTELIMACRIISINTGIPIHWLAWPELMSNRATAENMLEVINAATIQEREIWEEAFTELVLKAGRIAFLKGFVSFPFNIDKEEFEIRLPLISLAALKQLQETWIPLAEMGYISKDSVRNKVPGINPLLEKQLIEQEKQEAIDRIANKFGNEFDEHNHEEDMSQENKEE